MRQEERQQRWRQGLENAKARLANSGSRPDWIAYNKRRIAKYEKLIKENKPLPANIASIPGATFKENIDGC